MKNDFLDPIINDVPKGCWSLQSDSSKRLVYFLNNICF